MTPLLPQPLPWLHDEALPWARGLGWEGAPAVGSVAIQPVPHLVDEGSLPPGLCGGLPSTAIPSLIVRCHGNSSRPSWHGASGLYGFVGLPPGDHSFEIEDPLNRFLPARLTLSVPDLSAITESLLRCERPSLAVELRQLVYRVALRRSPAAPRSTGSTGVWGVVLDGGRPVPLALVQVKTQLGQAAASSIPATATTWSGSDGSYRLDLDGERPDRTKKPPIVKFGRDVRLFVPKSGASQRPAGRWIERIPADLEQLIDDLATGSAAAHNYDQVPSTSTTRTIQLRDGPSGPYPSQLPVRIGQQHRWDIVLT